MRAKRAIGLVGLGLAGLVAAAGCKSGGDSGGAGAPTPAAATPSPRAPAAASRPGATPSPSPAARERAGVRATPGSAAPPAGTASDDARRAAAALALAEREAATAGGTKPGATGREPSPAPAGPRSCTEVLNTFAVDVEFADTPLRAVLGGLQGLAGIYIDLAKDEKEGGYGERRVSVASHGEPLGRILERIAAGQGLEVVVLADKIVLLRRPIGK
ncbi:MAG: hypothetical protein HYZ53_13585 [Planctomycetes bacterium]|nr:hypothetical protein [Planctomycetota bacterium]